jgi:hypothetical protein
MAMRWLFRRKSRLVDTDWDVFSGYPPDLTMRRRVRGKWEYRKATTEECIKFRREESELNKRLSRRADKKLL